jgi:hypothetical protein
MTEFEVAIMQQVRQSFAIPHADRRAQHLHQLALGTPARETGRTMHRPLVLLMTALHPPSWRVWRQARAS